MNLSILETMLHSKNPFELQQLETGESVNDIPGLTTDAEALFDSEAGYLRLPNVPFFQESNVYIAKHNRFAPMVQHIHDFIEINYVYSGKCIQTIRGEQKVLTAGALCILDRDVPHSLAPLAENDILINILINNQSFSSLFLSQMNQDHSLIGKFLSTAFNKQAKHDQYILFDTCSAPQIHAQIQLLLQEYWRESIISPAFISQYLQLILSELMRLYRHESTMTHSQKFDYLAVMDYIDQNYQTVSLNELKTTFNYNQNYISNALKKATGKNFQEILLEKKLLVAEDLLIQSQLPIEQIAGIAGFHSTSYFYRQFKRKYQQTPKNLRSQSSL